MKKPQPLHWQTSEYEEKERHPDWFWSVGILTVAIAATSIILNNVLFALIILLGGFSLTIYAIRKPKKIDVALNEKGVLLDKLFYPYYTLESFWIEEHETHPRILIKSQKLLMPYLVINIEEVEPEKVRKYLVRHIHEVFHSESIFHRILERLGF